MSKGFSPCFLCSGDTWCRFGEGRLCPFPAAMGQELAVRGAPCQGHLGLHLGSAGPECQRAPSQGTKAAELAAKPVQTQGRKDGQGEEKAYLSCLLPSSPTEGDSGSAGPSALLDGPNCVCSCWPAAASCQQGYK